MNAGARSLKLCNPVYLVTNRPIKGRRRVYACEAAQAHDILPQIKMLDAFDTYWISSALRR